MNTTDPASSTEPEIPPEETLPVEAVTTEPSPTPEEEDNKSDMQTDPTMIIIMFLASLYVFKLWLGDLFDAKRGNPHPKAFPGAFVTNSKAVWIAVIGAVILVLLETGGEYALGVSAEQSDITWLFLLSMIAAAFFEELIFRGYLVITNKGQKILYASIFGFSLIFALLHPFLWDLDLGNEPISRFWRGEWTFDFGVKAWFSTAIVFVNSLWFYYVRFYKWNDTHSLIPCMTAHLASNLAVFVIKLMQGHVVGLY